MEAMVRDRASRPASPPIPDFHPEPVTRRQRARTAAKSAMPAATDAFSDSTGPRIGISTRTSQALRTRACIPRPSLPTTTAEARSQS